MKLLTVFRFAWVAFSRRLTRQVIEFPLLALFGVVGTIVAGIGLGELYRQTYNLLSAMPEALSYSAQYRLVIAIMLIAFIVFYMVVVNLREPAHDRVALVAAPLRYSSLWLGTNSIALVILLAGLTAITFPLIIAILHIKSVVPASISRPVALMISLALVARSGVVALCVWSLVRFLKSKLKRRASNNFLGVLLDASIPLFTGVALGWPLIHIETVVVDPAGYMLTRYLLEPSTSLAVWMTAWLFGPAILSTSLVFMFLDRTGDIIQIATSESSLSRCVTYGGRVTQFIVCEIKRFLRQKTLLVGYIFLVSLLLLWAYSIRWFPGAQASVLGLLIAIAPYLGVTFPLLTLHNDLQSDWVFRSAPLSRLTYLTLKLIAAAIIAGVTTLIAVLGSTHEQWQIPPGLVLNLFSQTLGLTGVAFVIGGVLRRSINDAAGQVFVTFLFLIVGVVIQYGINATTALLSAWGANMLWIALFVAAPLSVRGWEKQ